MLKWIIYLAVVCSVFAADAFSTKAERGDAERDVQTGDDLLEGILTTSVVARSDGTDETKTLENVQTASKRTLKRCTQMRGPVHKADAHVHVHTCMCTRACAHKPRRMRMRMRTQEREHTRAHSHAHSSRTHAESLFVPQQGLRRAFGLPA